MKKLVRESINIDESLSDKFIANDPNIGSVGGEFDEFEKKYAAQQQRESKNGELIYNTPELKLVKDPQTLKGFGKGVRGVITEPGDLYLELVQGNIHNDILAVLKEKQLIPQETKKNWGTILPTDGKFLTVQRNGETNDLAIGESNKLIYSKENFDKYVKYYEQYMKNAKAKCPGINFIPKLIGVKNVTDTGDHIIQ